MRQLMSGYRWLRWAPNALIRAALSADWHYTRRTIGEAPQARHQSILSLSPVTHSPSRSATPEQRTTEPAMEPLGISDSSPSRRASLIRRASQALIGGSPLSQPSSPSSYRRPNLSRFRSITALQSQLHSPLSEERGCASPTPSQHSMLSPRSCDLATPVSPSSIKNGLNFGVAEGFDTTASPLQLLAQGKPEQDSLRPKPPIMDHLLDVLTRASHAECEPGTTSDVLQVILGRCAPQDPTSADPIVRAWGFSLSQIRTRCKIWWGDQDDKVSERGVRWLERALPNAELEVVKDVGHGLLSCADVMMDVLGSFEQRSCRD